MLAFGSSILFIFREHIILLLFTEDFLIIKDFLFWQILGDVFKVFSFLFGIIITARANIKLYVCLELFTNVNFMISAMIFIDINGIAGATHAYLYTYIIHFFLALHYQSDIGSLGLAKLCLKLARCCCLFLFCDN